MNITSRQLKAFVLTARHQSFSRAAEELFITQSGMSVLVRELESQLGFRLFERTTRKVVLTDLGGKFLPVADRSLRDLESAATNLGRLAGTSGDTLAIGVAPFPAAEIMPQAIHEYAAFDPKLHIRLVDAEGAQLMEMVQSGKIDVAVCLTLREPDGVVKMPLARFPLVLVCPEQTSRGLPAAVRWADVAALRLIGLPSVHPIQRLVDEQLPRVGRYAPPELVCNFLETQFAMVEAGAGAAVTSASFAPACARRRVSVHAIVDPVVWSTLYWVRNRAHKLSSAADAFGAFLKDHLGRIAEQVPLAGDRGAEGGERLVHEGTGSALQHER